MEEVPERHWRTASNWGVIVLGLLLACAVAVGGFLLVREHRQTQELTGANQKLAASLVQMQGQLAAIGDKLNTLASAPPPAPMPVVNERPSAMPERHAKAKPRMTARRAAEDARWKKMQDQLDDEQKQLASTRDDVEKTRNELQGNLNSTRDELNGSIARTHDQLVALEKRGEKNYFEFTVDKSKSFQRVGPVSLSLRKVDFKRKHYDLALMVDDFQLQKKSVNLFEPVWITLSDRPQPVELVVNEIHKDEIRGYISEPKYKKSELASAAGTADTGRKLLPVSSPQ